MPPARPARRASDAKILLEGNAYDSSPGDTPNLGASGNERGTTEMLEHLSTDHDVEAGVSESQAVTSTTNPRKLDRTRSGAE